LLPVGVSTITTSVPPEVRGGIVSVVGVLPG
jgi:hypothetical protein